jgi:hypothetical protein
METDDSILKILQMVGNPYLEINMFAANLVDIGMFIMSKMYRLLVSSVNPLCSIQFEKAQKIKKILLALPKNLGCIGHFHEMLK